MAVLAAAALLDELMGRNRNVAPNDKGTELNWEDPEYCKYYLVKFCPHDLFVNTRADLGQCPKVHDDEVKGLFDKSTSYKKVQYEDEFIRFCQSMLSEVERKIGKGKQRLALIGKADAVSLSPAQTAKNEEQINFLTDKINSLVDEAEQMGIQGNVEQAQGLMKLCDQLKEEREQLRGNNENSHWQQTAELAAAQEKAMEVCDVCGAFLIVGDAQQRIDDHLMGKQHVGYARLKMALEETMNKRQKQREEKEKKREADRRGRRTSRPRDEEDRGRRDKERDRSSRARDDKPRDEKARDEKPREEKDRDKSRRTSRPRDEGRRDRPRSRSPKKTSRDSKNRDDKERDSKGRDDRRRDDRGDRGRRDERGGGSSRRGDDKGRSGGSRGSSHRDHRSSSKRDDDRDRKRSDKGGLNGDGGGPGSSPSRRGGSGRHHQESRGGGGGGAGLDS